MKSQLFRGSLWVLLAAGLSFISITAEAESHCAGNSQAMKPRLVAGALLIVPVKINQAGPFDFIVDTGSQLNVIDSALAAQLKVKSEVTVGLVTAATVLEASVVVLDSLETGSQRVAKPLAAVQDLGPIQAAVQDLGPIQAADSRIRGVLGENFLAHFDVLIDYPHGLLCLDEA